MEMLKREKTLMGLFLKYVTFFCVNTILLIVGGVLFLCCMSLWGKILPANYAESQLTQNVDQIRNAGTFIEKWIPNGCTYGVYNTNGTWLDGNFSQQEQKNAWKQYKKDSVYATNKGYYRFIYLDNGNVCIVKYYLIMRYSNEKLNSILPPPELLMLFIDIFLFILNAISLSRGFAKKLQAQLQELSVITEKIAGNDLEFETKASDIKEINEVMVSFGRMKEELKNSLQVQWDMEKQKQEQLAALAHDIKTPLTIIRGNAELLEEGNLSKENLECAMYILTNANEIEEYLDTMKQVLYGTEQRVDQTILCCESLVERFRKVATQLSRAEKIPVAFDVKTSDKKVCCNEVCILRAWSNIIYNAIEHTDRHRGIAISIKQECKNNRWYLVAMVRDYGFGFSSKDLQYADKEFYSGDASRHDRRHQGLGLAIAKRFVEEQGGFLEYRNSSRGVGAKVALWLKIENKKPIK